MNIIGLIGIVVALVLLVYLVYKGLNVIIVAPLVTMLIIVTNSLNIVEGYSVIYLGGLGGFVTSQWPIYLWGAIFGELYHLSGGAKSIARFVSRVFKGKKEKAGVFTSILIVFIAGLLMSYGGISGIVLLFVMMPLTVEIIRENKIPRKMGPGILLGCIATAGLCMPGSPQQQNVIPMMYLKTSSLAGMVPGFVGGFVVLFLNLVYLNKEAKKEIQLGHFDADEENGIEFKGDDASNLPNPIVCFVPLIITFVLFNAFKLYITYAIVIGILSGILLFRKQILNAPDLKKMIETSVPHACFLVLASGSLSGFGTVVGKTETFLQFSEKLGNIPGPPILIAMLAFMAITGICGSGPAAMGAGLPIFSGVFTNLGVNVSALHRVASFCGTTLDTLPTNAGFIAASGLVKRPAGQTYKYVGICTVINTTIATLVVTILLILFPGLA
jgi:H+/gluconate symporter-like permease